MPVHIADRIPLHDTAYRIAKRHNESMFAAADTKQPEEPKPSPEKPGMWHFNYCVEDRKTLTCGYVKSGDGKPIYHVRPGSVYETKTAISHHNKFVGENT